MQTPTGRFGRVVTLCGLLGGCGGGELPADEPGAAVPRMPLRVATPGELRVEDVLVFDGGLAVRDIVVAPSPLVPGSVVTVSMTIERARGEIEAELSVVPPRAGARQVALGGVDAPPVTVPPDPRARSVSFVVRDGAQQHDVALARPWHASRAMLTLTLTMPDGRRIHARTGPRTEAGVGVLAMPEVAPAPTSVTAVRAAAPVTVDGMLDDAPWQPGAARPHALVGSLDGEPWGGGDPGRVRMAWDDAFLYAAFEVRDADVWCTFDAQDAKLWEEEVFELFVFGTAPARRYLELQVSPCGVTFDARFTAHRDGDFDWDSTFATAVMVDGTTGTRDDTDGGWRAEMAVPWSEICEHTDAPCPPQPGARLRVGSFRFERPKEGPTVGLALSPTHVPDFHAAEGSAIVELAP